MKKTKLSLSQRPVDDWSPEERRLYLKTIGNKLWRIEHFYKIKDKLRQTVNLILNPIQKHYWQNRSKKDFILKARKIGFSTLCLIDDLDETIWNRNFTTFIFAHKREDVQKLFKMIHFAYDKMPREHRPVAEYYNKNELFFKEINSTIYVGMEARSDTINRLHVSEVAFVRDAEKKCASSFEAVPEGDGKIVLETTPNGVGGYAYELYQFAAGYKVTDYGDKSEFKAHFYPWYYHPEYAMPLTNAEREMIEAGNWLNEDERQFMTDHALSYPQMKWRKSKQGTLAEQFIEQYPENDIDCFLGSGNPYFDMHSLRTQLRGEKSGDKFFAGLKDQLKEK